MSVDTKQSAEKLAEKHFPDGIEHHDQMCRSRCEDAITEYIEAERDAGWIAAKVEALREAAKQVWGDAMPFRADPQTLGTVGGEQWLM